MLLAADAGKELEELESEPEASQEAASSNRDGAQQEQAEAKPRVSGLTPTKMESGGVAGSGRDSVHDRWKAQTGDSASARDS